MKKIYLIYIFLYITLAKCYSIEEIYPLEHKDINLNESNKYVIFEFDNQQEDGIIYLSFKNGKVRSTYVTVYYDKDNININETEKILVDYNEQDYLYSKYLSFKTNVGKMYFIISNFEINFSDNFFLINNKGYSDITKYGFLNINYQFENSRLKESMEITFSFKNNILQKNFLFYQVYNEYGRRDMYGYINTKAVYSGTSWKTDIKTQGIININKFKNDTINIFFYMFSRQYYPLVFYWKIALFFSDYQSKLFPLMNDENVLTIPSVSTQTYYIFNDIIKAYNNIFFTVKNTSTITCRCNYYKTNDIGEVINNLPSSSSGTDIFKYKIENNLFKIPINLEESYKSIIFYISTDDNVDYNINFFNKNVINAFQNYTFSLNLNQRYILYEFYSPIEEYINIYFKNGNMASTKIHIYNNYSNIYIDKNNTIFNYDEIYSLTSKIYKIYSKKEKIYILISNFENDYSDIINIINPNDYFDITYNQTFQYFYQIPNNDNNIILTFSFNNKIKNKNYLYYQIYNYKDEQIDNTQIYERNSKNIIPIDKNDYGGIINLTDYKSDYINIKFNISCKNEFNSIIISIYYSNFKNLFELNEENNYFFNIPSTNKNEFFIFTDISNIYENINFLIKTELKEISNKYYFYETNDINQIYSNLPNNNSDFDGYYNSNLIDENSLSIYINKEKTEQKAILLKMETNSNINISTIKYDIYNIKSFDNKTINLNEIIRYKIYEFENKYNGIIYIYFKNQNMTSTLVSVFNDIYKININEDNGQILGFVEQKFINNNTFLTFQSYIGYMYFVFSNFEEDYSNELYIINNLGYTDITNYEIFKYKYNFQKTTKDKEQRPITFSFKNDVKQKNYLNFQINNEYNYPLYGNIEITTKISNQKIIIKDLDTFDISQFKNETINIYFNIYSFLGLDNYDILIYYSDYAKIFPVMNVENSFAFIPSIKKQKYYIFIDITNAYRNIFLSVNTIYNFTCKHYLFKTNNIEDFIDNYPTYENNNDIIYSKNEYNNLFEVRINNINESFLSALIEIEAYGNAEYKANFFKSINISPFQNYTFNLDQQERIIIYDYNNNNIDDYFYIYFKNSNLSSTNFFIYFDIYEILYNKNDSFFKNYDEIYNLTSNMFKIYSKKEKVYILISNFENDYSDTINIINPNDYFDITYNQTFQYFYQIPNNDNNIILTFSFNNKIKNKNYLYYQIYNYKDEQIDNTQIYERNSKNIIPIDKNDYGGIINLTDYKSDYINIKFNISSKDEFNSIIISIYYSNYKNLFELNEENNYFFYIPSTNKNEFFIYSDISYTYETIGYLIEMEYKNISNKYYYYETNDINKIYLNLPNNNSKYDGNFISNLIGDDLLEININKTNNTKKSILLKMEINTNTNISLKKNYEVVNIKPFENVDIELNEKKRYIIYEFDNEQNGTIYLYFDNENLESTTVSVYYNVYEIYINEKNGEILYFNEQKTINKAKYLTFKSYIGKMYFVISNYIKDFSNTIYIINNFGFTDITNYDTFQYIYNFEKTNNLNEQRVITFSFNNNIKQKNFLYYQIKNNKTNISDYTIIYPKVTDIILDIENDKMINISKFKNETINIIFNFSSSDIIDSIEVLIFYSDYKNIFELNYNIEDFSLDLYSINYRPFLIFIDLSKATENIVLKMKTTSIKNSTNKYYYFENNQIKEIEKYHRYDNNNYNYYSLIKKDNYYEVKIYRYSNYFKSILVNINIDKHAEIHVKLFKSTLINSYDKIYFTLYNFTNYIIYEYNKQILALSNEKLDFSEMIFIYLESNCSGTLQIDIYKNYSNVYIDPFNGEIKNSFFSEKFRDKNHIELEDLGDIFYIVISNFDNKFNNSTAHSIQLVRNTEYYDITSTNIFKYNFKFNKTMEKRSLSFKINTEKINYKYLHFQLYNYKSNQIESFVFKTLLDKKIDYNNNCINLIDNLNQTILMTFGLSSNELMDNYDIILRQSNYSLIYPFNQSNIIEIPFINSYTFYIFSNLLENDGYEFIINNKQEEIEYYYLETEEFNENNININSLESDTVKTIIKESINNTNIFDLDNEIKSFTIEKNSDKNKAVILKIKIDGLINFKIYRNKYIKEPNYILLIVIITIVSLLILIIIGFIIIKIIRRHKKNKIDYNMNSNLITNNNETSNNIETPYYDNIINKSTELNEYSNNGLQLKCCDNINDNVTPSDEDKSHILTKNENIIENQNNYNKDYEKPQEVDYRIPPNERKNTSLNFDLNNNRNSINSEDNNYAPPPIAPDFIYNKRNNN